MSSEDIRKAQNLQQQILLLEEHLRLYKQRLIEVETALRAIKQAKERGEEYAYQFLGANVMVRRNIDDIVTELTEEHNILKERVKTLENQARELKNQLYELSRKLEAARAAQGA